MVFSMSAAVACREEAEGGTPDLVPLKCIPESEAVRLRRAMQKAMTTYVGINRTDEGLAKAAKIQAELTDEYEKKSAAPFARYPRESRHILEAAKHVIDGAIARKQNVGLHFNVDQSGSA